MCGALLLCWFGSLDVNALVYITIIVAAVVLILLYGEDLLHCGHKERDRTRCLLCPTKSTTLSMSLCQ